MNIVFHVFVISSDKVILFLSDVQPTDRETLSEAEEEILRVISEENVKLNNSVIIQTYGIGRDKGEYKLEYRARLVSLVILAHPRSV